MMDQSRNGVEIGDRRPIKTRDTGWAKKMACRLAEFGISPNTISVAGMVAAILGGGALSMTSFAPGFTRFWWLLGAAMAQLRLLANMFDGMVAIESKKTSLVGDLYNEIPDRISDIAILVGLGWASGSDPMLGMTVAVLAVFVAYVRAQGKASGAQNEFCGPMAKPQRMFLVTVTAVYCALTPLRLQVWFDHGVAFWMLWAIAAGCVFTAWRRLLRIAHTLSYGGGNG